jgi:hypothetical protein
VKVAASGKRRHTANMIVPDKRGPLFLAILGLTICAAAIPARADEIRLKDGKKLNGVIVAYEDNMFKVKTDFGYVLVEKDKIASIIPSTPASATAKTEPTLKPAEPKPESAAAGDETTPATASANAKPVNTNSPTKRENSKAVIMNAAVRPELPASAPAPAAVAPAIKTSAATPVAMGAPAKPPAPPKEEPPANREEVQGNVYTNYTYGFRMYKAPSWLLMNDARMALPNAIAALGTSNESTLMVIGQEKTKAPLDAAASTVEKRLHDVYVNYRQISQRKTVIGGLPAVEYRYSGVADEHLWSGTLVVIARGGDVFSMLGMTYADTDLIQIQENVIARAIASLDFSVH